MYYPYVRGKQFELIAIREVAQLLKESNFVPIIEPVKESFSGLSKTLAAIEKVRGGVILVVNPFHGELAGGGNDIPNFIEGQFNQSRNICIGILLTEELSVENILEIYNRYNRRPITFIHSGFSDAKTLARNLPNSNKEIRHVFHEEYCGKLYRRNFPKENENRILIRDGFERRINREHPDLEFFSDLHATYEEEQMNGFGDFLIVGDEYSESGGPAYAVAIHLTFIDPDKDDEMRIHHFKSIRQDDPRDPAGKFSEALKRLVEEVKKDGSKIYKSKAVEEFLDLNERGHFPGLGYVKKLSMKHHIEVMSEYFKRT